MRPRRDENRVAGDLPHVFAESRHFHGLRSDDFRAALNDRHMVPLQILVDEAPAGFHHRALAKHEIADRDVVLHAQVDAVQPALTQAAEVQRGFTQRLRGDRPGVHGGAARLGSALHHTHALAEVCRLRRSLLAGGTGADDDEIEVVAHESERRVSASS